MSTIAEKIRDLRMNKEWTQAELAEKLSVSESTIQKWEVEKNNPPITEIKRLADIFGISIASLVDEKVEFPVFFLIDYIEPEEFIYEPASSDSSPHAVYDACLKRSALLHRFKNKCGVDYSAIYIGRNELMSCERDSEQDMINCWNEM